MRTKTSVEGARAGGYPITRSIVAVVFVALACGVAPDTVSARERGAFHAIPKVTVTTAADSGTARLYSGSWGVPAGRRICSAVFADGIPGFDDPVTHLPLHPVDITFWKSQKPAEIQMRGYRTLDLDGSQMGEGEDVAYELERARHGRRTVWVARIDPVFVGQYLVTVEARWHADSPCSMGQEGAWSVSLETGI